MYVMLVLLCICMFLCLSVCIETDLGRVKAILGSDSGPCMANVFACI